MVTQVVVFASSACNSAVIQPSITMSDSEVSSSDSVSERRDTNCSSDLDDTGYHFVFKRDFAPYQGEPALAVKGEMADNADDDEEDEDCILPSVLEQRFEREGPVDDCKS